MKTAECEGIEAVGELLADACVARVESVEPIAGGHNVKAVVDAGRYGARPWSAARPIAGPASSPPTCPSARKSINGVESDGMLASASELGINRDHAGIIELRANPAHRSRSPPTSSSRSTTSRITHRPDLWGHHGMAREVAAITGRPLSDPVASRPAARPARPRSKSTIEDLALCPRYSALVFENVTVQPSPLWLQAASTAIGLNPINNIVDLTNYIMAELAQPMHAFDRRSCTATPSSSAARATASISAR